MFVNVGINKNRDGFTMIEVIVTLVILAVLAAFAIPTYLGFVKDSQAKECAAYTAMLTRDCQQAQKELTDSPTRRVLINETQRNKIFYEAIFDEFNVDLQSGSASDIKIIEKDGKKMVAGICQDGGNYYTQTDNGNINVYCDKHDGMIPDINPDVVEGNNVTINYLAAAGGSVSTNSETIDASALSVSGSTASANAGYTFVNWTKNGAIVSTEATFKPSKNAEKYESATYTANFSENKVTITYRAEPDDRGSVSPDSEEIKELAGTVVMAVGSTATPAAGNKFSNWVDSSGAIVGSEMTFYPQPVNGVYSQATYTARFIAIGNVGTIGDVNSYFWNAYQNWDPMWYLSWDPVTWNFTWWRARTEIGVVYSYINWPILWGWMAEAGTYVSVGKLDQGFSGWYESTDNFYRALSPEEKKKFIKITDSTPLYKAGNVASSAWLVAPPTFGNLYEYGNAVYIWTSENASITPPTDPTASGSNNYWVRIVK
ncbi:MAG: prepilin-type N-terminal cleavage/methylation domain-containing protein [Firmicutes bacterium]|nr:prepilin-type N-terminal cleavage/methylation domain-containing protein [Bacillota bacterium]